MSTTLTKLGVKGGRRCGAGLLLLGAGTAQADVTVNAGSAPGGVDVWVQSGPGANGPGMSGWCTYTSFVQGDPFGKPAPAINVPLFLPQGAPCATVVPELPDRLDGEYLGDVPRSRRRRIADHREHHHRVVSPSVGADY